MKESEKEMLKDKFFQLRAIEGKSLRDIESELGVTKKTLCKWGQEMSYLLKQADDFKMDELAKKYRFTEIGKLEILGELHEKFSKELKSRSLEDIPTDKLITGFLNIQDRLKPIGQFHTGKEAICSLNFDRPEIASF